MTCFGLRWVGCGIQDETRRGDRGSRGELGVTGLAHTEVGPIVQGFREASGHRESMVGVELGFAVVVMTVMVVVRRRSEGRGGEHEDQENSSKDLLHGGKCSTMRIVEIPMGDS